jgi:hypothetical protein
MVAVVAHQIGDRRASHRGREEIGMGCQERRVETAPRVAHDTNFARVDEPHLRHFLHGRAHAVRD